MQEVAALVVLIRKSGHNRDSILQLPNAESQGSLSENNIDDVVTVHF